jgi:hypothetical protein
MHDVHYRADDGAHMKPTTWQRRLDGARRVDELVEASRDFVATFTPEELAALPESCWPPARIRDGDDIANYAFELVRHECEEGSASAELIEKLARFFSCASMRLAQLAPRTDSIA